MTYGLRLGLSILLAGGFLGACGVAPEDYYINNTDPDPVQCERQIDCYRNGNLEVGTDCIQNQCRCHEPGEAPLPCCKKGNDPNNCDRKCRPADQCEGAPDASGGTGTGGSTSSGGPGSGGAGGLSGGKCNAAVDCPGPEDTECGEAKCIDGVCRLDFVPLAKTTAQKRGDCVSVYCNGLGKLVSLPDGEDIFNDGRQCTIDVCRKGEAINELFPDGSPCPETGLGFCYMGECVDCIDTLSFASLCGMGFACDGSRCVPGHCTNMMTDSGNGETDWDCGGPCVPCPVGDGCSVPSDCQHGVCIGGKCAAPSCSDMVHNDSETGTDCGGPPSCPRCPTGEGCDFGSDCANAVCWAGICEDPKCDDGLKNGEELGIDCSGPCTPCK